MRDKQKKKDRKKALADEATAAGPVPAADAGMSRASWHCSFKRTASYCAAGPLLTAVPPPVDPALTAATGHKRKGDKKREKAEINHEQASKKAKAIQEDPNTSTVYKSLFTTSEACKKQPRAHWVTYNPQYF